MVGVGNHTVVVGEDRFQLLIRELVGMLVGRPGALLTGRFVVVLSSAVGGQSQLGRVVQGVVRAGDYVGVMRTMQADPAAEAALLVGFEKAECRVGDISVVGVFRGQTRPAGLEPVGRGNEFGQCAGADDAIVDILVAKRLCPFGVGFGILGDDVAVALEFPVDGRNIGGNGEAVGADAMRADVGAQVRPAVQVSRNVTPDRASRSRFGTLM
jgi:hypothetical protein